MDYTQRFISLLLKARNLGLTNEEWSELRDLCYKTIGKADFHLKENDRI